MTNTPKPVAMSIMAHPDDAEFSSTGTLLTWINEGYDAYICVITDASAGGSDDATDLSPAARQVTIDTRKKEQAEAKVFKAFAKAIKMAVKRNPASDALPSTKGLL